MAKILTEIRRNLLTFWFSYHAETNLWPTYQIAAEELNVSKNTICYHIKFLLEEQWMTRDTMNLRGTVALSKYGEGKLFEAALFATGKKKKEITKTDMLVNKLKKA